MTEDVGVAVAVALSSAGGIAAVAAALGRAGSLVEWLGRAALGAAIGLGASSVLSLAWLLVAGGIGPRYFLVDAAACVTATGALVALRRTRAGLRPPAPAAVDVVASAALVVLSALAIWRLVVTTERMPHGEWDAWDIWNLRARHVFRAGQGWRGAFADGIRGAEYPLLVPLSIVRAWAYGGETTAGPAAIAGVFTVGVPLVAAAIVARLSTVLAGATAGLLLLGTAKLHWWGALQYADVPLSLLVAAGAGVLAVALAGGDEDPWPAVLGGALLGLAGWTKTEGVAAAALAAVAAVALAARRGRAPALRVAARIAAGAAVPALAWLVQHTLLTPALAPQLAVGSGSVVDRLLQPGRWQTTLTRLWQQAPGREVWLLPIVVALALVHGARPRTLLRSPAAWCAAALYGLHVVLLVATPLDLDFHLLTAGDRLMLQPWPALVVALLAAGGPPARDLPATAGEGAAGHGVADGAP